MRAALIGRITSVASLSARPFVPLSLLTRKQKSAEKPTLLTFLPRQQITGVLVKG